MLTDTVSVSAKRVTEVLGRPGSLQNKSLPIISSVGYLFSPCSANHSRVKTRGLATKSKKGGLSSSSCSNHWLARSRFGTTNICGEASSEGLPSLHWMCADTYHSVMLLEHVVRPTGHCHYYEATTYAVLRKQYRSGTQ